MGIELIIGIKTWVLRCLKAKLKAHLGLTKYIDFLELQIAHHIQTLLQSKELSMTFGLDQQSHGNSAANQFILGKMFYKTLVSDLATMKALYRLNTN